MSQVKITGNASGTGVLTIAAPNTNTDRTFSLPDETGTVLTTVSSVATKVPLFMTEISASDVQQVTANTWTKVVFDTEEVDTHGLYDTSNGRFTPQTAGYYQINAQIQPATAYATQALSIYKNGVSEKMGSFNLNQDMGSAHLNAIVYANGSSDYFELYWRTGTTQFINGSDSSGGVSQGFTYFQGYLIRAA